MFVISMKASKKKVVLVLAAILVVLIGALFFLLRDASGGTDAAGEDGEYTLAAATAEERVSFLGQFGWEVNETPMEQVEVLLPAEFNEIYEKYNQIQKEQGMDLLPYAGTSCWRYTYEVTNYPGKPTGVVANLLVKDDRVIGGDICAVELNGFIHGFAKPEEGTSSAVSETESSAATESSPESADSQAEVPTNTEPEQGEETASSEEPKYPVESSTERETLAPDPAMPNAPVD